MHKAIEEGNLGSAGGNLTLKYYISITLVLNKIQPVDRIFPLFLQVERTFVVRHVTQKLAFLTHLIA